MLKDTIIPIKCLVKLLAILFLAEHNIIITRKSTMKEAVRFDIGLQWFLGLKKKRKHVFKGYCNFIKPEKFLFHYNSATLCLNDLAKVILNSRY